jgi:tetratricopeptide (TPR) repeat protein
VANLVPLATFLAEHWLYVPSMGLFVAAGWVLARLMARGRPRLAVGVLALLLAVYGLRTVRRNSDWRDERTFLESTLQFAPNSARVHGNLGRVYFASGDVERAKAALARAIELEPDHVRSSDAHDFLGLIAQREGHYEEAIRHYRRAIELNARAAAAYVNLAAALQETGRLEDARRALEAALLADPNLAVAHMNLGNIHAASGDFAAARREFEKAVALDPDYALAYQNLGRLNLMEGRADMAVEAFRRALELEPDSPRRRTDLDAALRMQRATGTSDH